MNIQNTAKHLRDALESGIQISPLSGHENLTLNEKISKAYEIQKLNVDFFVSQGRRIVGRKIGLTSLKVQNQLGVDQPDFGVLFADMAYGDGELIDINQLIQPKIEAEIALVLKKDLNQINHTLADIISATEYALPALEIVDSRIENWKITLFDTIADNASSALFVLGSQPVNLSALDLPNLKMKLFENDVLVSEGSGRECLGNPLNAAIWLADKLVELGTPLKVGDILLTGALGPMVTVQENSNYRCTIDGFSDVLAKFSGRNNK